MINKTDILVFYIGDQVFLDIKFPTIKNKIIRFVLNTNKMYKDMSILFLHRRNYIELKQYTKLEYRKI